MLYGDDCCVLAGLQEKIGLMKKSTAGGVIT
jgi:hypothetical protein